MKRRSAKKADSRMNGRITGSYLANRVLAATNTIRFSERDLSVDSVNRILQHQKSRHKY